MANLWKSFAALVPGDPLLIGDVAAVNADGSRTVDLLAGGSVRASGTATVGTRVFVRAGRIESTAPALDGVTIEI